MLYNRDFNNPLERLVSKKGTLTAHTYCNTQQHFCLRIPYPKSSG